MTLLWSGVVFVARNGFASKVLVVPKVGFQCGIDHSLITIYQPQFLVCFVVAAWFTLMAAKRLRVTENRVRAMIEAKSLKATRVGKRNG